MAGLVPAEQHVAIRMAAHEAKSDIVGLPSLTPAQKPIVEAMVDQVYAKEGDAALKIGATEFTRWAHVPDVVNNNILTDVDAAGNSIARAGTTEAADSAKAVERTMMYQDLLLRGYDHVGTRAGLPQALRQTELRNQVDAMIRSIPVYYDALKDASGNIPQATLEAQLRDRNTLNDLATWLNDGFDPTKMPVEDHRKLMEARTKVAKSNAEVVRLTGEKATADVNFNAADEAKKIFETGIDNAGGAHAYASASGIAGTKEVVFQTLSREAIVQEYINKKPRYDVLAAKAAAPGGIVDPVEAGEFGALRPRMIALEAEAKVAEHKGLAIERNKVNNDRTETKQKQTDVDGKLTTAKTEEVAGKNEENNITLQLRLQSADFSQGLERALTNALSAKFMERVNKNLESYPTYKQEAQTAAVQKARDAVQKYLDKRYNKKEKLWYKPREQRIIPDKASSGKDVRLLMSSDPDAVTEAVLGDMVSSGELTLDESNQLKSDKDYMTAQRASISGKALAAYTAAGGRLSEAEVNSIALSSWSNEVVTEWISKNEQVKTRLEKLHGAGVTKGGASELLNKLGWQKYLLIILIALGIFVAGPAVLGVIKPL